MTLRTTARTRVSFLIAAFVGLARIAGVSATEPKAQTFYRFMEAKRAFSNLITPGATDFALLSSQSSASEADRARLEELLSLIRAECKLIQAHEGLTDTATLSGEKCPLSGEVKMATLPQPKGLKFVASTQLAVSSEYRSLLAVSALEADAELTINLATLQQKGSLIEHLDTQEHGKVMTVTELVDVSTSILSTKLGDMTFDAAVQLQGAAITSAILNGWEVPAEKRSLFSIELGKGLKFEAEKNSGSSEPRPPAEESKNIRHATDESFKAEVLDSDQVVVVDFWAPWCGPCREFAPILNQLADEYAGRVKVYKLNVDDNGEVPTKYKIRSIPTVMIFKKGEVVETAEKDHSIEAIRELIQRQLELK